MDKEKFDKIKEGLERRIAKCEERLNDIHTGEDLWKMTVQEAHALKLWATAEMSKMDQIVCTDLYHIVGMGKLTASQTNTFLGLMRKYMGYRSDVKSIAYNLSLDNPAKLPYESEYKLSASFGGIKVKSELRCADARRALEAKK